MGASLLALAKSIYYHQYEQSDLLKSNWPPTGLVANSRYEKYSMLLQVFFFLLTCLDTSSVNSWLLIGSWLVLKTLTSAWVVFGHMDPCILSFYY